MSTRSIRSPLAARALAALTPAVLFLAAGLLLAPAAAKAEPARYKLDESHLVVAFAVKHLGFADVLGQFLTAKGSFLYDAEAQTVSEIDVEIDATSVFSNHGARDNHIRGKDFLNSGAYPVITFVGTGAKATGETTGEVTGDLTIRGNTKPVTLQVTLNRAGAYPFGDKHYALGISARTSIKRSEFGMTYALEGDMVEDEVDILLEFEAIRQDG